MPYFPTGDRWTWAKAPPKLSIAPPQHQPRRPDANQRPLDNGWNNVNWR